MGRVIIATSRPLALSLAAILPWAGSIADIPSGWALCDGTNGTPDLRDCFLSAATYTGNGYGYDTANRSHAHGINPTPQDGPHSHTAPSSATANVTNAGYYANAGIDLSVGKDHDHTLTPPTIDGTTGAHSHTFQPLGGTPAFTQLTTDTSVDIRPPYYALAYIQGDAGDAPVGSIVNYAGLLADLPSGWHTCDGTNGTPDLNSWNRFVIGAGDLYAALDTGGDYYLYSGNYPTNLDHTHGPGDIAIATENAHQHPLEGGNTDPFPTTVVADVSGVGTLSGLIGANHDHAMPAWYTDTPATAHNHAAPSPFTRLGTYQISDTNTLPTFYYLGFVMRLR